MGIQVKQLCRPITKGTAAEFFRVRPALISALRDDPTSDFPYTLTIRHKLDGQVWPEYNYEYARCCELRRDGGDPQEWRSKYPEGWEPNYEIEEGGAQ